MKIELWVIGKTKEKYLQEGINIYQNRLNHYTNFSIIEFPDAKDSNKLLENKLKQKEANDILAKLKPADYIILLDEKGKTLDSVNFASIIEGKMLQSKKKLIFLIGGAYGFSSLLYQRADFKLSFSNMTFSHQMIRLFFCRTTIQGLFYHTK